MKVFDVKQIAFLCAILVFGWSCTKAPSSNPSFDWVKYRGFDEVYSTIETGGNEVLNPILPGFYPDPSIVRVEDDYYLINSTFSYYPGIPIFHSKDLKNWKQIGNVLDRPEQLPVDSIGISRGIFAPTIHYNGGLFYVICTLVDAGGNFYVTAEDPAGPWSNPTFIPEVGGIDPSFFFDDDGKVYILNNDAPEGEPQYQGHRAIWMHEFDLTTNKVVGDGKVLINGGVDFSKKPIWIEGPHLMKINGEYILHDAEGGTGPQHSQVVLKSDNVWGPYIPYEKNPILTQRDLPDDRPNPVAYTGHADLFDDVDGNWWAVFLGVRLYDGGHFNTGRETFLLPVEWRDGWPVILDRSIEVPYKIEIPDYDVVSEPNPIPLSGNFEYTYEFDGEDIGMDWLFIRTPREKWYSVADGSLDLQARSVSIGSLGNPTYLGRRQQHAQAEFSASMEYLPEKNGDKAGIVAFQNREFYYLLGITKEAGQTQIFVEKAEGESVEMIQLKNLPEEFNGQIYLGIEADRGNYHFRYSLDGEQWMELVENADGTILSTNKAGGFVGTTLGVYAYSSKE